MFNTLKIIYHQGKQFIPDLTKAKVPGIFRGRPEISAEKVDEEKLVEAAAFSPIAWTQRLGYILDMLGETEKADRLSEYIKEKKPVRVPLMPALTIKGSKSNRRWQLLVNAHVEADT